MLLDTLKVLKQVITEDDIVVSLLASYHGSPAFAFMSVPNDMRMPYIVTRTDANNPEDNLVIDRLIYCVDIFFDNADLINATTLCERVEQLLDREKLFPEIGIGIWRDSGPYLMSEQDPSIIHIHVKFLVRHTY